jgi:hypothetical protein
LKGGRIRAPAERPRPFFTGNLKARGDDDGDRGQRRIIARHPHVSLARGEESGDGDGGGCMPTWFLRPLSDGPLSR